MVRLFAAGAVSAPHMVALLTPYTYRLLLPHRAITVVTAICLYLNPQAATRAAPFTCLRATRACSYLPLFARLAALLTGILTAHHFALGTATRVYVT